VPVFFLSLSLSTRRCFSFSGLPYGGGATEEAAGRGGYLCDLGGDDGNTRPRENKKNADDDELIDFLLFCFLLPVPAEELTCARLVPAFS